MKYLVFSIGNKVKVKFDFSRDTHTNTKYRIPNTGFTLIEVMVYSLVFSVFLLLITQIFVAVKSASANSRAVVSLQENYARLLADLSQTIKSADTVTLPALGGSGISLSLNGGDIVYRIEEGMILKDVGGVPLVLTDERVSVINPVFERLGEVDQKQSVRITFTLESNYLFPGERKVSEEFQTAITLR